MLATCRIYCSWQPAVLFPRQRRLDTREKGPAVLVSHRRRHGQLTVVFYGSAENQTHDRHRVESPTRYDSAVAHRVGKRDGRTGWRKDRMKEGPNEGRTEGRKDRMKEGPKEGRTEGRKDRMKEGPNERRTEWRKDRMKEGPKEGRTAGWPGGWPDMWCMCNQSVCRYEHNYLLCLFTDIYIMSLDAVTITILQLFLASLITNN